MTTNKHIELIEVDDGYQIIISGHNKLSGKKVRRNDQLEDMIQLIGEVVLDYKVKVERK